MGSSPDHLEQCLLESPVTMGGPLDLFSSYLFCFYVYLYEGRGHMEVRQAWESRSWFCTIWNPQMALGPSCLVARAFML